MYKFSVFFLILWSLLAINPAEGQLTNNKAFPHNFTNPSPIPHGCIWAIPQAVVLPPEELFFYNEVVQISQSGLTASIGIRVWRIGCHEPGRSAIAIQFRTVSGSNLIRYPAAYLSDLSGNEFPAGLYADVSQGRESFYNFNTPAALFPGGETFILETATFPSFYNGALFLRLDWGTNQILDIPIFEYDPQIDITPFALPPIHGRYTGNWVVDGIPNSGLLLQIGEVPTTSRNFIFAIYFTYIDGFATWVVGNRDFEIGSNEIVIDMFSSEGGEFFTLPPGTYTRDDIVAAPIGTFTIRANHCNELEADVDFTAGGLGSASLTFNRLIRIAGYDCDQTQ